MDVSSVLFIGLAAVFSAVLGFYIPRVVGSKRVADANELAKRIVEEARKEAAAQKKEIVLQGKDEVLESKRLMEQEIKEFEERILFLETLTLKKTLEC